MKLPIDYRPKYSLSIAILAKVLSPKELDDLIRKYVRAKSLYWKKTIRAK